MRSLASRLTRTKKKFANSFTAKDLSNEQIYLRKKGRVRKDTWEDWKKGIQANLSKPAFLDVWNEVKDKSPGTFSFLEALEKRNFNFDPKTDAKF